MFLNYLQAQTSIAFYRLDGIKWRLLWKAFNPMALSATGVLPVTSAKPHLEDRVQIPDGLFSVQDETNSKALLLQAESFHSFWF